MKFNNSNNSRCLKNNKTFNKTLLHHACSSGKLELVKSLISLDMIDITCTDISFYFLT